MHPISKVLADELISAFKERRQAVDMEITLKRFSAEEVEQWRLQTQEEEVARIAEQARTKAERAQQRIQARLAACLIPPKFRNASFDALNPVRNPEAFNACRRLADKGQFEGRPGLILTGASGNGKTSLSVAALRRFVERTQGLYPARFWNVNRGLQSIRENFDEEGSKDSTILDLCTASLVVIDDFDKVRNITSWVRDQFYTLIDTLYVGERSVIITTNLSTGALFEMLDDCLASRLMGMCAEVEMKAHDYRAAS